MKISATSILCAVACVIISCTPKEDAPSRLSDTMGKYIYRDDNNIHHTNLQCLKLRRGKDSNGHDIYAMHPMDTSRFVIVNPEYFRVCSRCVSEQTYEHIIAISCRNSLRNEARRWLYDKLVEANYDMPDYETYDNRLEDVEVRSRLYRIAQEEHWDVGVSEKDLSKLLGF